MTRRQLRRERKQAKNSKRFDGQKIEEQPASEKKTRSKKSTQKSKSRKVPIWLRILVLITAAVIAILAGLIVGYGVIGDGSPLDALRIDTWKHIIDIVKKD